MKFGWLHDMKNEQKWDWCRAQRAVGRVVGMHWYLTDVEAPAPIDMQADLASNYSSAFDRALEILERWDVVERGRHFVAPVPTRRSAWTNDGVRVLKQAGCTAVLLDPDTGIAIGSTCGRQHVSIPELVAYAEAFDAVAVFQHAARAAKDQQQLEIARQLGEQLGNGRMISFTEVRNQHFLVIIE